MEENPTKRQKFWKWIGDHTEEIVVGTTFVVVSAFSIWYAMEYNKEYNQALAEAEEAKTAIRQVVQDAISRGDSVLPGPDGEFWIVPRTS